MQSSTQALWVAIHPQPTYCRVLVQVGPQETLLKARLNPVPASPRALASLLEGLALWQSRPVRAALCVESNRPGSVTNSFLESIVDYGRAPLYELDLVVLEDANRRRHRDGLVGMGDFRDLRRVLASEVAR